jgi:hypothetical protein
MNFDTIYSGKSLLTQLYTYVPGLVVQQFCCQLRVAPTGTHYGIHGASTLLQYTSRRSVSFTRRPPFTKKQTNKLYGLSPRANYTDRATAACRRSDCQIFADKGCHVVSVTDPYDRILDFLDRSRYFSIK